MPVCQGMGRMWGGPCGATPTGQTFHLIKEGAALPPSLPLQNGSEGALREVGGSTPVQQA